MRLLAGGAERGPIVSSAIIVGSLAVLATAVLTGLPMRQLAPAAALAIAATFAYRTLLSWRALLAATILVILFIPIRRYQMPGHLPFQLEPYRLLVALVALGWIGSLLVDPRVRIRGSGLSAPLWTILLAAASSVIINGHRVNALGVGSTVGKKLTFLVSYLIVFYLILSVARRRADIEFLVRVLVVGGVILSCFGLLERATHYNLFDHLSNFMPFLRLADSTSELGRGGHVRITASAQHPIALGAVLVMLLPLAVYLARSTGRRVWWAAGSTILLCAAGTLSRTGILMLLVIVLVYLRLRPGSIKRLWPLIVPGLLVVHIAMPGTIGTLQSSFFPKGGLIHQQQNAAVGSGRIASLGPGLHVVGQDPFVGQGYGTRVVDGLHPNSFIVDDQWLSTAMETGLFGVAAWVWLFGRYIRRLGRAARRNFDDDGWLLTGLMASTLAYAVGMFTFDAFSFIQVTFVLFIFLALGAALLAEKDTAPGRYA
jgi:O-antigen ligase/polysaccharide polymerase Wzy-like membrane protein